MGSEPLILIAVILAWLAGFIILARLKVCEPHETKTISPVLVSIVIPARNEEQNLPKLLGSINAEKVQPLEVLVVDDGSTDRTSEIARQLGAAVIPSKPLPDGWRGKTWACQQGADQARGEVLLFLDADTWFETDGLQRMILQYHGGALSIGPYHAVREPYEQFSVFFNVIMNVCTVPHGLFGQMLLVDRKSYEKIGGHEVVKDRILENFFLAEQFRKAGISSRSMIGKGVFSFRMYPNGIAQLIEGWTKGFASGAGKTGAPMLLLIIAWLTGMILLLGSLPFSKFAVLLYLAFAGQLAVIFRRVGSFRWYTAFLYPLPLFFYVIVFVRSALRTGKQVNWKGRSFRAH